MQEDLRNSIFNQFLKLGCECEKHQGEVANMIITKEEAELKGLVCVTCLSAKENAFCKEDLQIKSLKIVLLQIHQSCQALLGDVITASFVDHHILLIRGIAKTYFKQIEANLQASITSYFQRLRELLNGKYFQEFYSSMSNINALRNKEQISNDKRELHKWNQRLFGFILNFQKLLGEYEDYQNMTMEDKMAGKNVVKYIKAEVGDIYKEFRDKAQSLKKNWQEEEILTIFNTTESSLKHFKFSSTLINPEIKIIDQKSIKMPNLPDNQFTLLSLIEPCIGNKKRSIKLKMDGIKGWVAVGIAFKTQAENTNFKFQQSNHGTVQISYDGYSWSNDSSVNEQYTSWYFNQGDIITMTVSPATGQLLFQRNEQSNTYTLKFSRQKKEKIHFCVSLNYNEDAVTILD